MEAAAAVGSGVSMDESVPQVVEALERMTRVLAVIGTGMVRGTRAVGVAVAEVVAAAVPWLQGP
jgi:hypothetical protein